MLSASGQGRMINPVPQATSNGNRPRKQAKHSHFVELRIEQIRQCLHQNELSGRSALWLSLGEHRKLVLRLAKVLDELGEVFTFFHRYLAQRPDLIPSDDCLILESELPVPPMIDEEELNHQFLNTTEDIDFAEESPPDSTEVCSILSVRTSKGSVRVEIRRDTFIQYWDIDKNCLAPIAPVLKRIWPYLDPDHVILEFQSDTKDALSFKAREEWLTSALQKSDPSANQHMVTSKVRQEFLSDTTFALSESPGETVSKILAELAQESPRMVSETTEHSHYTINTRILCQTWLNQAFLGDWYPVTMQASHLSISRGSQSVVFHGGIVASPSQDTQLQLLNYVMSTAFGAHDEVAESLAELMDPAPDCEGLDVLKRRIGQIVPFRDGGWAENGKSGLLADHLFIQWRIAKDCGYRETEHFQAFHRSIIALAHIAVRFAPDADLLKDAIYEFRMRKVVADLVESGKVGRVLEQGEQAMELFFDFSHKFKRIIENNSTRTIKQSVATNANSNKTRRGLFRFFGLYTVLLMLAVAATKLPGSTEGLITSAFLAVSLAILHALTRLR